MLMLFRRTREITMDNMIDEKINGIGYSNLNKICVSNSIESNKKIIMEVLNNSSDIIFREICIEGTSHRVLIVYISGMVNEDITSNQVLMPLMIESRNINFENGISISVLSDSILTSAKVREANCFDELILSLFSGETLLFLDKSEQSIIIGSRGGERRSIEDPKTEQTIRGSREGFVEDIETNLVLIRRRVKDPNLVIETFRVGERSQTEISIVYIKGIINNEIPEEIRRRIRQIDTDGIIGSAQIEQFIEKHKWTLLPQVMPTERPDRLAINLFEGRLGIIVDGSPFVSIIPTTFGLFLNSSEDFLERSAFSSFVRLIRYFGFFIATTLPAAYLSLVTFHPGMIPTALVTSITATRAGVPFPIVAEVLMMEFTLDILQEASIRLPKPMGQTIGIVGGLVIGQAVVQAGIVSPIIVIIVAMTAITSFAIPIYSLVLSTRIIRILLILASTVLGIYGIGIAWIIGIIHAASLEDFGVRYLGDYSPYKMESIKDTILRAPKNLIYKRPDILDTEEDISQPKKEKSDESSKK
jgi:hypothetical protein